jgi:ketosteroid isomerase-like protein
MAATKAALAYAYALLCVMVAVASPGFADDEADLMKQMDQFNTAYVEGFNKRDAAAMVANYATNAIVVTSRGPQRDMIKFAENVLKAGFDHAEVQVDKVWLLGPETAIGMGQSRYTGKNQSGAPIEAAGFWTATYVKEDGKWKIRMLTGVPKPPPSK